MESSMQGYFILKKGYNLIWDIEKDDGRTKNTTRSNHLNIKNVCNSHKHENKHLSADAFESDFAG